MKLGGFGYLIKEGFRSVWSNRLMSLASVLVLLVCLLLIGAFVLITVNINSVLGFIESQSEIVVFLNDYVSQSQIEVIAQILSQAQGVESFTFLTDDEGLEAFAEKYTGEERELFLDLLGENFLPQQYTVSLTSMEFTTDVKELMEGTPGVLKVNAATDLADTLIKIRQGLTNAGLIIVVMLIVVSFIIIGNTIKLTVFNRRKEINIMKFVGATDYFIRLPFVIESIVLGAISVAIAYFITWKMYGIVVDEIVIWASGWLSNAAMHIVPFEQFGLYLLLGFAVGGLITCVSSSSAFVRKHLRV